MFTRASLDFFVSMPGKAPFQARVIVCFAGEQFVFFFLPAPSPLSCPSSSSVFFAFQDNSHDQWNSELPLKNASAG